MSWLAIRTALPTFTKCVGLRGKTRRSRWHRSWRPPSTLNKPPDFLYLFVQTTTCKHFTSVNNQQPLFTHGQQCSDQGSKFSKIYLVRCGAVPAWLSKTLVQCGAVPTRILKTPVRCGAVRQKIQKSLVRCGAVRTGAHRCPEFK